MGMDLVMRLLVKQAVTEGFLLTIPRLRRSSQGPDTMEISRKDIGYTIYSRLEEALRHWIQDVLIKEFAEEWKTHVPSGMWLKAEENKPEIASCVEEPMDLLEELDIPHLGEIVSYKKSYPLFVSSSIPRETFNDRLISLYENRIKVAHTKRTFSAIDLDSLIETASWFCPIVGKHGADVRDLLTCLKEQPTSVVVKMPNTFIISDENEFIFRHRTNLPGNDYDPDGGFIGRKNDFARLETLVLGDLHRVVTVSGAGGVGKTALVQRFCERLLARKELPFDAIVWTSAKEDKLGVTGIESIVPSLTNYESLMDAIIETFGWSDDLLRPLSEKIQTVESILKCGDRGILLIVDNLESIADERILEFIKDFPPPGKVLITSRLGLGEVERRFPLDAMSARDAAQMLRVVANEKGLTALAKLHENVLVEYASRMSRYPLAIKWVLGQVALGKDINKTLQDLISPEGDVAKFCFEKIFSAHLDEHCQKVLFTLAASNRALPRGVISHISGLQEDVLDQAIKTLTVASLILPVIHSPSADAIKTDYELLPLTKQYVRSKLNADPELARAIQQKINQVESLIESAETAHQQYRYSLALMGAQAEEEKIAATWAQTGFQRAQAGDYDGANLAFKRAAEIAPEFATIYRNWGAMEAQAGQYERAEQLFRRATELNPRDATIWFVWGNVEKERNRYDKASLYLNTALKVSPDDPFVLGALGQIEKIRTNYEKAEQLLRSALERMPKDSASRRHEVVCYTSLADNSRRWAEQLLKTGQLLEGFRRLNDAVSHAKNAVGADSSDSRAQETYRKISADAGLALLRNGKGVDGIKYLELSITENPRNYQQRKQNAYSAYYACAELLEQGKVGLAKKYYAVAKRDARDVNSVRLKLQRLAVELENERYWGKLVRIVNRKGFGFLESERLPGQLILLHYSEVLPRCTCREFDDLAGSVFSFIVEQRPKGPSALRARLETPEEMAEDKLTSSHAGVVR
jgi:tetratricopeptide (TPR) repeat protein